MAFCAWLTKKDRAAGRLAEGEVYRLPAESEWENACRGKEQGTKFWWGNSVAEGQGRMNGASADKVGDSPTNNIYEVKFPWSDGFPFVSPVDHFGTRGRNGFGLADMLGNVWEWCADFYQDGEGVHEEVNTVNPPRRVDRGSSFRGVAGCRCAFRSGNSPNRAYSYGGFRVVLGVGR